MTNSPDPKDGKDKPKTKKKDKEKSKKDKKESKKEEESNRGQLLCIEDMYDMQHSRLIFNERKSNERVINKPKQT